MDLETVLLAARGVMNLATFLIVASYYERGARYRPVVSFVATGIAGCSLSLAVWTAFDLYQPVCRCSTVMGITQQTLLVSMFAILLGLVARCKGNIAKLLPWRLQR